MNEPDARRADPSGPILAGDIGGTNARLAIVEERDGRLRVLDRRRYDSAAFEGLASVVGRFLDETPHRPRRGCLALAAPLRGGRWRFPNLDWLIEPDALRREVGLPSLELVNDFDAVAHAIDWLEEDDVVALTDAPPVPRAPRAVLGAGTGLGAAFAVWCGDGYRVVSSEGGHVDFAPVTEHGAGLLAFLRARHGRVSCERVLSGAGLAAIYRYLAEAGVAPESERVRRRLEREDPAAVVAGLGMEGEDRLCTEALELFVTVYGAQAGNLALLVQAHGGVFVAGGIAPRILPKLRDGTFTRAFHDKGRLADMMAEFPLLVITRGEVGLLGAAAVARGLDPARAPDR